jgi:hypothetical protein
VRLLSPHTAAGVHSAQLPLVPCQSHVLTPSPVTRKLCVQGANDFACLTLTYPTPTSQTLTPSTYPQHHRCGCSWRCTWPPLRSAPAS